MLSSATVEGVGLRGGGQIVMGVGE